MSGYRVGESHPNSVLPPYRLKAGDLVRVEGLDGKFTVLSAEDPAIVTLALANGSTLRVGWRNIREGNDAA